MPYYLTKVLPLLLMPISVALATAIFALVLVARGRRRPALCCLISSILVLWVSSLPAVASRVSWSLEGQYQPVAIEEVPDSDCMIVLGGALRRAAYPRVGIELTNATDRVYQATKLFRAGKAKTIIVAAGNQPWNLHKVPEAQLIKELLVEWGIPRQVIKLDTTSKNTHENANNAAKLAREFGCETNLLITSAWHLPRAVAAFKKAGVETFAFPVDAMAVGGDMDSIASFIPEAGALAATSETIREWIGIWVYRWRGWN